MAYYECGSDTSASTNLLINVPLPKDLNYTVSTNLSGKSALICLFTFLSEDSYYKGKCYKAVYFDITDEANLGITYEAHLLVAGGYTGVDITPSISKIVFNAYVHDKNCVLYRVIII